MKCWLDLLSDRAFVMLHKCQGERAIRRASGYVHPDYFEWRNTWMSHTVPQMVSKNQLGPLKYFLEVRTPELGEMEDAIRIAAILNRTKALWALVRSKYMPSVSSCVVIVNGTGNRELTCKLIRRFKLKFSQVNDLVLTYDLAFLLPMFSRESVWEQASLFISHDCYKCMAHLINDQQTRLWTYVIYYTCSCVRSCGDHFVYVCRYMDEKVWTVKRCMFLFNNNFYVPRDLVKGVLMWLGLKFESRCSIPKVVRRLAAKCCSVLMPDDYRDLHRVVISFIHRLLLEEQTPVFRECLNLP